MNTVEFNERFDFLVNTIRKAMQLEMHGTVTALTEEFAEFCNEYGSATTETAAERRHDALRSDGVNTIVNGFLVNGFPDEYDVGDIIIQFMNLETGDMQKVAAIKAVRARTGLGLKEAKDLVEKIQTQVMSIS